MALPESNHDALENRSLARDAMRMTLWLLGAWLVVVVALFGSLGVATAVTKSAAGTGSAAEATSSSPSSPVRNVRGAGATSPAGASSALAPSESRKASPKGDAI